MTTMDKGQQQMIDSPMRQLFQSYYEFGVIRRQLRRSQIQLQGKAVLDAGCASGYSTQVIARMFRPASLYAFDLMPEQIERARQRGVEANFFVGDIATMELPDAQFDAAFTFGVFHHVPVWTEAVAEVYRVLKPGGVLVGGEMRRTKDGAFTWAQFAQDLAAAGFHMRQSQGIYFGYFVSFVCQRV
ncbi:MAG: class I SAM-dependent methyltransferase [Anaerolineae bacterium]|nr:class I SAM-dependent methyltransferase [Anaerolineae bacterium]